MGNYRDFHRRSIEDRDGFWAEQAKLIDWKTPFEQVCDYSNPPFARWYTFSSLRSASAFVQSPPMVATRTARR